MASKDSSNKLTGSNAGAWIGIFVGIVLAILTGLGYYFSDQAEPEANPEFEKGHYQNVSNRITAWVHDKASHFKSAKQLAQHADAEQAVHFEFYNALPSMKVVEQKSVADRVKLATTKTLVDQAAPKLAANRSMFLDPKELEEDFAQVIPKQGYVLQLATFSELPRAKRYRAQLDGYHVDIIKAYVGDRQVYRVQVGPFSSRDEVRATENILKKKGYSGIVRKIQMG